MRNHRSTRLLAAAALASLVIVTSLVGTSASARKVPQWVKHVQHWNGGISNGVRERAAQAAGARSEDRVADARQRADER